jgi:membrane protein YqaA with SNARE-associated domain
MNIELQTILFLIIIMSGLLGGLIGYRIGSYISKFRGITKGRHNIKLVKKDENK